MPQGVQGDCAVATMSQQHAEGSGWLGPPPGCGMSLSHMPTPWHSLGLPRNRCCPSCPPRPTSPPTRRHMCWARPCLPKQGRKAPPGWQEPESGGNFFPTDKITLRRFRKEQKLLVLAIARQSQRARRAPAAVTQGSPSDGAVSLPAHGADGLRGAEPGRDGCRDTVTWVWPGLHPGCLWLGFCLTWVFRAWESFSSATCMGDLPELPCSLHVLKKDNKFQLCVCLGQNSLFLLMPAETTRSGVLQLLAMPLVLLTGSSNQDPLDTLGASLL